MLLSGSKGGYENHRPQIELSLNASLGVQIGSLISQALERVGRQGVVTQEESRTAEDELYVVEGMQFDRGYISPYFVTDPERMVGCRPSRANTTVVLCLRIALPERQKRSRGSITQCRPILALADALAGERTQSRVTAPRCG